MYFENQKVDMRKSLILVIVGLFVWFIILPPTLADSFNIDPFNDRWLNDTSVWSQNPAVNYYTGASNSVQNATFYDRTYFSVDLTELNIDDIIESADLTLYGAGCAGTAGHDARLEIHEVTTDSIAYESKTWNNQPCGTGFDSANCNSTASNISNGYTCANWTASSHTFPITEMVKRNLGSTLDVVIRNFKAGVGTGLSLQWTSDDGAGGLSHDPYINITYSVGGHGSPIWGCQVINTAGEYYLNASIKSNQSDCIHINTSHVSLDLHHFNISNNASVVGGDHSGIYIAQDGGAQLKNISIVGERSLGEHHCLINGFTYGIYAIEVDGLTISNLTVLNNDVGIRVYSIGTAGVGNYSSINSVNFTYNNVKDLEVNQGWFMDISDNVFDNFNTGTYNMYLIDLENSTISQNKLGTFTHIDDLCVDSKESYFGYCWGIFIYNICAYEWNATSCVGGTYGGYGADYGVYCYECFDNFIVANTIYGDKDFVLAGNSYGNYFALNVFLAEPSVYNGLHLETNTHDNIGCQNEGNIINSGTNNIFSAVCEDAIVGDFTAGYYCSGLDLIFVDSFSNVVNTTSTCAISCVGDGNTSYCEGLVAEEETLDSFLNIGAYIDGGSFIDALFTPFWILTMFLMGLGVWFENQVKSNGIVFGIVMIVGILGFTYLGIYPAWVGYLIIIIGGFLAVSQYRKGISG